MTHSTHFYLRLHSVRHTTNMWDKTYALTSWNTFQIFMWYFFRLVSWDHLHALSQRQDKTYHGFWYINCEATDRIAHTTAFVTPVMEHWLEREIAKFHGGTLLTVGRLLWPFSVGRSRRWPTLWSRCPDRTVYLACPTRPGSAQPALSSTKNNIITLLSHFTNTSFWHFNKS